MIAFAKNAINIFKFEKVVAVLVNTVLFIVWLLREEDPCAALITINGTTVLAKELMQVEKLYIKWLQNEVNAKNAAVQNFCKDIT